MFSKIINSQILKKSLLEFHYNQCCCSWIN